MQKNDPLVLEQLALVWQLCDRSRYPSGIKPGKHSSTSRIWEMRVQQRQKLIEDFFLNKRYQHTLSHLQHNLFYRCNRTILSCLNSLHLNGSCGREVHVPGINHQENTHLCLHVWKKKRVIDFIALIIIVCPPQFKEESRRSSLWMFVDGYVLFHDQADVNIHLSPSGRKPWQQYWKASAHYGTTKNDLYIPSHVTPSPEYPVWHVQ